MALTRKLIQMYAVYKEFFYCYRIVILHKTTFFVKTWVTEAENEIREHFLNVSNNLQVNIISKFFYL